MTKNIYSEYITVTPELDSSLKKCFLNHLVAYNQALSYLKENVNLSINEIVSKTSKFIKENKISPIVKSSLYKELYYQYRKFKNNINNQKLIGDIQYMTFITKSYKCKNIQISEDRKTLSIRKLDGYIILEKELPVVPDELTIYINISYSNIENRYKLSIFELNDSSK